LLQRTVLIEAGPIAKATPLIDAVELLLQAAGAPPRAVASNSSTV
jgi:hypothetical protein